MGDIWIIKKEKYIFQLSYRKMRGQNPWRKIKHWTSGSSYEFTQYWEIFLDKEGGRAGTGEEQYSVQVRQTMPCSSTCLLLACWMRLEIFFDLVFGVLLHCLLKHIFLGFHDAAILFLSTRQTGVRPSHSGRAPPLQEPEGVHYGLRSFRQLFVTNTR